MSAPNPNSRGECFVITPIGAPGTASRRTCDILVAGALRPVLEDEMNFRLILPHEIIRPGHITSQVIELLLDAELVIANLSELNPNVMYELAVRHAKRLPIVALVENGTVLPFDLAQERTLYYQNDLAGAEAIQEPLRATVEAALQEREPDNPIYRVATGMVLRAVTPPDSPLQYIIQQLSNLQQSVNALPRPREAMTSERAPRELTVSERNSQKLPVPDLSLDPWLDEVFRRNGGLHRYPDTTRTDHASREILQQGRTILVSDTTFSRGTAEVRGLLIEYFNADGNYANTIARFIHDLPENWQTMPEQELLNRGGYTMPPTRRRRDDPV